MIITKTPFRMSFFGGGTDMEAYFRDNGGAVLSTTFDKYCYVTVRNLPKFFPYASEFVYSQIERVNDSGEIKHPAIREAVQAFGLSNIRINYDADLPARSGLGSSSSFAVGMLNAFLALNGREAQKKELANNAIYLERFLCNEAGGWQDQIAASFGGFNKISFHHKGYTVIPLNISQDRKDLLNSNLLMFFTGITRLSSDIQKNIAVAKTDKNKINRDMLEIVSEAEKILTNDEINLDDFGRLLHKTWVLKKSTSPSVSTDVIDTYYQKGLDAGALGGKLLGAGGGGFLVFYVPQVAQPRVIEALSNLTYIPFKFENKGTQIIYRDSDENIINKERINNAYSSFAEKANRFING